MLSEVLKAGSMTAATDIMHHLFLKKRNPDDVTKEWRNVYIVIFPSNVFV